MNVLPIAWMNIMTGWGLHSEIFPFWQWKQHNYCFLCLNIYIIFLEGLIVSLDEFWPFQLFHSITNIHNSWVVAHTSE